MSSAAAADADVAALMARLGIEVHRITSDSRDVRAGDAFAAYPGTHHDGRAFIGDAISRGAGAVLWETQGFSWNHDWKLPHLPLEDLKAKLGTIADFIYGHPSRDLWMVGVTGTNGKTSCAHWIATGLDATGRRSAVLGTLGNGLLGTLSPASNTTPDAALLQETLVALKREGAEAVAMEVSSHGLDQGRVNGVDFDVALFTNLSRDHLDYHGTMGAYGAAKAKLLAWPGLRVAVVNADDPFGRYAADAVVRRPCIPRRDAVGQRRDRDRIDRRVQRFESARCARRAACKRRRVRSGARRPFALRRASGAHAAKRRRLRASGRGRLCPYT